MTRTGWLALRCPALLGWLALGAAGFALVPWYALPDGLWSLGWIASFAGKDAAPALLQVASHGRAWLAPPGLLLATAAIALAPAIGNDRRANLLLLAGAAGFVYLFAQGFAITPAGGPIASTAPAGMPAAGQPGMGLGAALVVTAFAMVFALGLAGRGYFKGDGFVAGSVVAVTALVAVFTFFPVANILVSAFEDDTGTFSVPAFLARLFTEKVWGLGCLTGESRCGVAWNTLLLALLSRDLLHGARPRLRADRHPHRLPPPESCCGSSPCCRSSRRRS